MSIENRCLMSLTVLCTYEHIYSDKLSSAGAWLLCAFSRPCISSYGCCISSHFWIFVSTIRKSLRCQTNHNFRDGYLLLSSISITESYISELLETMLLLASGTGLGFTAINIAALTGTRRGFRINQYFSPNRRPNRTSSTIDSCEHRNPILFRSFVCTISSGNGRWIWLCVPGSRTAHGNRYHLYGFTRTGKTPSSSGSGYSLIIIASMNLLQVLSKNTLATTIPLLGNDTNG